MNRQKSEAETLRQQLGLATQAAIQADVEFSARLDLCLTNERKQAATDRHALLLQITDLVNTNGMAQDARLAKNINAMRDDMKRSQSQFQAAETTYNSGMDIWSENEGDLMKEVLKSRENLKTKMKKDWTVS